jgi:hypothetical protein
MHETTEQAIANIANNCSHITILIKIRQKEWAFYTKTYVHLKRNSLITYLQIKRILHPIHFCSQIFLPLR